MKTYIKVSLFVVVFVALAGILAALYLYNLKAEDLSKAKPDFKIPATLLQKEFEDNEITASSKYNKKIIEVTGTIASVMPAENNIVNITLKTGSGMSSVICTLPAIRDGAVFREGEEITLRGECSGFLMDVLLNNCAVIK
jgi:hypothetical protein